MAEQQGCCYVSLWVLSVFVWSSCVVPWPRVLSVDADRVLLVMCFRGREAHVAEVEVWLWARFGVDEHGRLASDLSECIGWV